MNTLTVPRRNNSVTTQWKTENKTLPEGAVESSLNKSFIPPPIENFIDKPYKPFRNAHSPERNVEYHGSHQSRIVKCNLVNMVKNPELEGTP